MENIIYWKALVEVVRVILDGKYFVQICISKLENDLMLGIVECILKGCGRRPSLMRRGRILKDLSLRRN